MKILGMELRRVSRCGTAGCPGFRACRLCRNDYMREWRANGKERPRSKRLCRVYGQVNMARRRGTLVPQPCEVCGAKKVHAHHDDYSHPKDVRWLCPQHHREHHKRCA